MLKAWLEVKGYSQSLLDHKVMLKALLEVKGIAQRKDIDYAEIFSLVVKLTTIQILVSIIASKNWYLGQMDIKTIFLHEVLDEKIRMQQPKDLHLQAKNTWCSSIGACIN